MTENPLLTAARSYLAAGWSLIPIKADGTKAPDLPQWKAFQSAPPTESHLCQWFHSGAPRGIGLVHGAVSGHSEALDFDLPGLYDAFADLCRQQGFGGLLDRVPLVETPSGGHHLLYRCTDPAGGNAKLAETSARKTLIETRAEGGYTLAPGSAPACHSAGLPYLFRRGGPDTLPVLSAGDRMALRNTACLFNQYADPRLIVEGPCPKRLPSDGLRPGDDYNGRGDYEAVLERHGWQRLGGGGEKTFWQRPGKSGPGLSATGNYAGHGLFHVFSCNAAPFEPQKSYRPFAVLALLDHGGDFREAAKALCQAGFGHPLPFPQAGDPAAPGNPWGLPSLFLSHALPPFPAEALPPVLGAYVCEIAASSQVPIDMAALLGLAVVGAAAARRCVVQIGRTHSEPLNLFCAVVMEPGSRKSAIMDMTSPLREHEAALVRREAPTVAAAKEARAVEEKRIGFLREQAAKEKDSLKRAQLLDDLQQIAASLTDVPALPRLLADDITSEKCTSLMAENAGALALLSAEGGVFGILAGRYSGKGDTNLDVFLKGHAGDEIRVDRQNRPPDYIRRPALTVGLLVQPDVIASFADNPAFRGRGLLGRFLYSLPESLAGSRRYQDRPVDLVIKAQYGHAIEQVLDLPTAATDDDLSARHSLTLTGDALTLWAEYADLVEARQAEGGDLSGLRDWGSKLAGQVARIAGGFHLMETAGGDWQAPIPPETIMAAWTIGLYLIPHAKAAFGQMGADPRLGLARRIARWLSRAPFAPDETGETRFTLRECHHAHTGGGQNLTSEEVQAALLLLIERDYLRPAPSQQNTGGRPAGPAFSVNPAVLCQDVSASAGRKTSDKSDKRI